MVIQSGQYWYNPSTGKTVQVLATGFIPDTSKKKTIESLFPPFLVKFRQPNGSSYFLGADEFFRRYTLSKNPIAEEV